MVRRSALALLRPRYFGGGTAAGVDADEDFFHRRAGPEGLEDGTPPFAALAALPLGFRRLSLLATGSGAGNVGTGGEGGGSSGGRGRGIPDDAFGFGRTHGIDGYGCFDHGGGGSRAGAAAAEAHAYAVARHAATRLAALRHGGGGPAVTLYGAGWRGLCQNNGEDGSAGSGVEVAVGVGAGGMTGQGPTVALHPIP